MAQYVIFKADPVISKRNIETVFENSNMPPAKGFLAKEVLASKLHRQVGKEEARV